MKIEIIKKKRTLITDWLNEYVTDQPNYTRRHDFLFEKPLIDCKIG